MIARSMGVLAAGLSVLAGCGYSLGYRAPANAGTIAIPIFSNNTFPLRRELEYQLTELLAKELLARTDLTLVADQREADIVVHGTIQDFRERVVAEGLRDEKIESSLSMRVSLIVEDFQARKRWRESVDVHEPFSIERGESLETARSRALGNLAERILIVLESWEGPPSGDGGG